MGANGYRLVFDLGDGMEIIAADELLLRSLTMARRVASGPNLVLITGETGSGKELIARYIHANSPRADKPFVDINCAALPEHLVESELFGHERGAFTGADHSKPGFFEMADGGTLFLDEVGELDLKLQSKLLRILDGNSYFRVGGQKQLTVDVRIIAATNQDLDSAIAAGTFRRDLYHRLVRFI